MSRPDDQTTTGSRLRLGDVFRVGASGPRARKLRTALSALGVSIGIAALVGVLGLSESSKSALLDEIAQLGTNLLTIEAGAGFGAGDSELPASAVGAVARIPTVSQASAVWDVEADVYRTDYIDEGETGGLTVVGTDPNLLDTLGGTVADGRFLDEATSDYPTAVLGSVAAERLGIRNLDQPTFVYIGDQYVEVIGLLDEFPLAADLDRSVMIGQDAAATFYEGDDDPAVIYARVLDGAIDSTRDVLPATTDPENPEEITVSRPSDALEAQAAADDALTTLFLGLGAVALLVGGIGIANVMVIAVIERRGEIGLRRDSGPYPPAVPDRGGDPVNPRWGGRGHPRRWGHLPVRHKPVVAGHHPHRGCGWRAACRHRHRCGCRALSGDASGPPCANGSASGITAQSKSTE